MRNYITHHAPKSHLAFAHRRIIEQAYNANLRRPKKDCLSMTALARELGLPRSTLSREVKLGLVSRPNTWKERDIWDYSVRKAQDEHDRRQAQKGCPMRMVPLIAQLLRQFILSLGLSPYDALCRIRETVKDLACPPPLLNLLAAPFLLNHTLLQPPSAPPPGASAPHIPDKFRPSLTPPLSSPRLRVISFAPAHAETQSRNAAGPRKTRIARMRSVSHVGDAFREVGRLRSEVPQKQTRRSRGRGGETGKRLANE